DTSVPGGFGAHRRAAEGEALPGEDPRHPVRQSFVHAVHESDLPGTHPDVPGRDVRVLTDVPMQLHHERLAEAHHLTFTLPPGVEVASALRTPHGKAGETVLEHLFKAQELEHAQRDVRVEPKPSLVRSD